MDQQIALNEHTDTLDGTVNEIESLFADIVPSLARRRDERYAESIAGSEAERESLAEEASTLEQTRPDREAVALARERTLRQESDFLLLQGNRSGAELMIQEAEQARRAPEESKARQKQIADRLAAIDAAKKRIARTVFEAWFLDVQAVCRAIERGHFIVFLEGLQTSFREFEQRTSTGPEPLRSGLIRQSHFEQLTAPQRSAEWVGAQKWYRGRA